MGDNATISDVRNSFASIPNVHVDEVDIDGHVANVSASDTYAGDFFKTLRVNGYDFQAKRLGGRLVAHVEIEEEEGLGSLLS